MAQKIIMWHFHFSINHPPFHQIILGRIVLFSIFLQCKYNVTVNQKDSTEWVL